MKLDARFKSLESFELPLKLGFTRAAQESNEILPPEAMFAFPESYLRLE